MTQDRVVPIKPTESFCARIAGFGNVRTADVGKSVLSLSILSLGLLSERFCGYDCLMQVLDLQHIGSELAIRWKDGSESFIALEKLRRSCPCAGCHGEMDILGNVYKNPNKPLAPAAFELKRFAPVGGYAIQLFWADGHSSGIYAFDYLQRVAAA